jgi:ribosome recycling factor
MRVEEGKVAIRNVRRDAQEDLKKLEKDKEISQDDHKRGPGPVEEADR